MNPNPFLGVFLHALGGFAAGSFYIPYKKVRGWAWEVYWLVGGFFSWIIAPWVVGILTCPDLLGVLRGASSKTLLWTYLFGVLWGVGGLTFGLSMRYLGLSLGMALSLGFCAVFGTLVPPVFEGRIAGLVATTLGTCRHARHPCLPGRHRRVRSGRDAQGKGAFGRSKEGFDRRVQLRQGRLGGRLRRRHELVHGLRLRRRESPSPKPRSGPGPGPCSRTSPC